jgi:glutamate-ammonia-ligase adenylyltransferase
MVDIEFAVQYLVLTHASAHPGLTRNAGNIALLHLAGDLGLAPPDLTRAVADAYRDYRRQQHALRLAGARHARIDPERFAVQREAVFALWHHVFGTAWQGARG